MTSGFSSSAIAGPSRTTIDDCTWACYFTDSVRHLVIEACNAWVRQDTVKWFEFESRFLDPSLPRSQFYLYASTLEKLTGLKFGAYEDPEEYMPEMDSLNANLDISARNTIKEYYRCLFRLSGRFKCYPPEFRHEMDSLWDRLSDKNSLDTAELIQKLQNLNLKLKSLGISRSIHTKVIETETIKDSWFFKTLNRHFKRSDKPFFSILLTQLKEQELHDSDFFPMAFDILNVMQIKYCHWDVLYISQYDFINEINYRKYRLYLLSLFETYLNSELCFKSVPRQFREDVYTQFYKSDFSNVSETKELEKVLNQLSLKLN